MTRDLKGEPGGQKPFYPSVKPGKNTRDLHAFRALKPRILKPGSKVAVALFCLWITPSERFANNSHIFCK